MDCPVCGERLREIERSGVMIDICPSCKGIWLDRGEIEKILAAEGSRSQQVAPGARGGDDRREPRLEQREPRLEQREPRYERRGDDDRERYGHDSGKGRRRTSFLEDILGGFGGD